MMCPWLIRRGTGAKVEDRIKVKQHPGVGADVDVDVDVDVGDFLSLSWSVGQSIIITWSKQGIYISIIEPCANVEAGAHLSDTEEEGLSICMFIIPPPHSSCTD